ncbi:uncharacterized protein LOC135467000 [Liolophura sinensis]|uniref:uncharacterized protein LOC135467000 n=1 Tax=Liolophura sinensis TaxID=3198878 RepID=UPI003158C9D7
MADSRGESRVSYAESAVVKHGIGDTPDLHPAQMTGHRAEVNTHRTVTFIGSDQAEKVGTRDIKKTDINLKQRLYFTPNDSQVVRIVQNKPIQKTLGEAPFVPSPPTNMKTTMFKRDYVRRQMELKAKHDPESMVPKHLTVKTLHRSQPPLPMPPLMRKPELLPAAPAEQVEVTDQVKITEPIQTATLVMTRPNTGETDDLRKSYVVSRCESVGTQEDEPTIKDLFDSERKYPGEMPIIDKQKPHRKTSGGQQRLPALGREISETQYKRTSRPSSVKSESETVLREKSATSGTRRQDPSLVLTYLNKKKYDDSVPVNDDVLFHLRSMRDKLNWPVELPRHGLGCKRKMAWLTGEEPYSNNQEEILDEDYER